MVTAKVYFDKLGASQDYGIHSILMLSLHAGTL